MVKLLIDINQTTQELNLWAGNDPIEGVISINLTAAVATRDNPDIEFNCGFTVRREINGELININYYACDKDASVCNNNNLIK